MQRLKLLQKNKKANHGRKPNLSGKKAKRIKTR
jgi:hypothetical protein